MTFKYNIYLSNIYKQYCHCFSDNVMYIGGRGDRVGSPVAQNAYLFAFFIHFCPSFNHLSHIFSNFWLLSSWSSFIYRSAMPQNWAWDVLSHKEEAVLFGLWNLETKQTKLFQACIFLIIWIYVLHWIHNFLDFFHAFI